MSDTNALITGIKENTKTEILTIGKTEEGTDITVVAHSMGNAGIRLTPTKEFIEAYRTKPAAIKGTATMTDTPSFIDHINKFKTDTSVYFADRSMLRLTAYYDYHAKDKPENLAHRGVFSPKQSRQIKAWQEQNAKPMNQANFANFIENNILDLCEAPDEASNIALQLGTTIATPNKLLELARGLSIHEASVVKNHVNTATGEATLEYTTSHSDGNGKKFTPPGLFCVGIPVFEGGLLYRVLVRLRYRIVEGKALWWYELYQLEAKIDDAFNAVIDNVKTETGLQLYRGSAEV